MKIIQANRSGTRTSLMDVFGCPMAAPVNSRKTFANPKAELVNPKATKASTMKAFANPFVTKTNPCGAFANLLATKANPFVATINTVQAFGLAKSRKGKANVRNGNGKCQYIWKPATVEPRKGYIYGWTALPPGRRCRGS